jgi:hypothetical protein
MDQTAKRNRSTKYFMASFTLGALFMFFFDPAQGKRRRKLFTKLVGPGARSENDQSRGYPEPLQEANRESHQSLDLH